MNVEVLIQAGSSGLTLAGGQVPAILLYSSAPQLDRRRRNKTEKLLDQDKGRERSLTCYHYRQNRLDLGKITHYHSYQSRIMINTNIKTLFSNHSLFPRLNFTQIFYLLLLTSTGGWEMGVIVSLSRYLCHSFLPPCSPPLLQHGIPPMGASPM